MKKLKTECEGCKSYCYNSKLKVYYCFTGVNPHLSETESCPCSTCLIKMVCETDCEKFASYMAMTHYLDKEDYEDGK